MERHRAEEVIKKGPWTAEEDEVLIKFVNKYGPKEWSSIRSMGLLPRTGKSCRLRWVNKLRPNLKIGCKFSAEEERMVIDLQARFGNKWAAIASYLPGRTDNDVKNFWSTRQKRLARILQSPTPTSKSQKIKGKALAVHEIPTLKAPEFNLPQMKEEPSSSKCQSCSSSSIGDPEMLQIMPLPLPNLMMMTPNLINVDSTTLPLLDIIDTDHHNKSSTQTPLQLSFTHLPLLPESHDPVLGGLIEANFLDVFASARQVAELETVSQLNFGSPFLELEVAGRNDGRADSFFDELPADMFDYLEPIPASSPV